MSRTALALFGALALQGAVLHESWLLETRGLLPQAVAVHAADPEYLFVALKTGGVGVLRLDGAGRAPRQVATVPRTTLGNLDAMNLFERGSTLFVALGDHFAALGSRAGLALIDVSHPESPERLSMFAFRDRSHGAADVVAGPKFAYLAAMNLGVAVFDISEPHTASPVTTFLPDADFPRPHPNALQRPNARGLALEGDRLFVADDAGGLRVLDVADPARPREIGRYLNAALRDKQQAYNSVVIDGTLAYVAVDYAGLEIIDVSNPAAMTQVGWWNPWQADTNAWFNSPGHTNQIALDRQRRLVYLSAGDSELQVVDVSNPRAPALVAHYGDPKDGRGAWGLALGHDDVYLAYITAIVPFRGTWAGIRAVKR